MATDYNKQLNFILQELRQTIPATVIKLETMGKQYDSAPNFYVAYVVLCLQLHVDRYGCQALEMLTHRELMDYIPAEALHLGAWDLIVEVVQSFCTELHVDYQGLLTE